MIKTYKISKLKWFYFNIMFILKCKWIKNNIRKERWKYLYRYNNLLNINEFIINPDILHCLFELLFNNNDDPVSTICSLILKKEDNDSLLNDFELRENENKYYKIK